MNKEQKAELIELIRNDCKTRRKYINRMGETCAIGCLAQAAGVNLSYQVMAGHVGGSSLSGKNDTMIDSLAKLYLPICDKFGIDNVDTLLRIQNINDCNVEREERIRCILAYIDTLDVKE